MFYTEGFATFTFGRKMRWYLEDNELSSQYIRKVINICLVITYVCFSIGSVHCCSS